MERRLFTFFIASLLIWSSYLALQMFLVPPPQKKNDLAAEKLEKKEEATQEKATSEKNADAAEQKKESENTNETETGVEKPSIPRSFHTLGSLDPASGYNMLVTFDNQGGAIHRIELNSSRYHDLNDTTGYLGHLELLEIKEGLQIQVVGPGTPSAEAEGKKTGGLKPLDIITMLEGNPIANLADWEAGMQKSKPEDTVEVTVIRNKEKLDFSVKLSRRPLEVIRPELQTTAQSVIPNQKLPTVGPPSYRMTLLQAGDAKIGSRDAEIKSLNSLYNGHWKASSNVNKDGNRFLEFSTEVEDKSQQNAKLLTVTKRFTLPSSNSVATGNYHLQYDISFKNELSKTQEVAYRLEGPNGLPIEGWWYTNKVGPGWGAVGARDVAIFTYTHLLVTNPELITNAEKQLKENNLPHKDLLLGSKERQLGYLAVDTQYFASALLPANAITAEPGTMPKFPVTAAFAQPLNKINDKYWKKTTNVSFLVDSLILELPGQETKTESYLIFAGPKVHEVLETYHLARLNEYGWTIFRWVSQTLSSVLRALYFITRNYGISIILLTVIVRLGLLPFSIRQAKSAALMQQLAPELAKIKDKYASNMEEQARHQRELFAKHGFNPMGGCLLMFAQLPIFIGLYRCLSVDIELREASLIPGVDWCANLAGPDKLLLWRDWMWPYFSDEGAGWLGPFCNILPLITIVLFVIQQKMFTPPATDDETRMQQNIMTYMTFFMGILFYKVPAGLCIYFITSSIWGIAERKLLPKPKPGELAPPPKNPGGDGSGQSSSSNKKEGGNTLLDRIMNMADKELKKSKKIQ